MRDFRQCLNWKLEASLTKTRHSSSSQVGKDMNEKKPVETDECVEARGGTCQNAAQAERSEPAVIGPVAVIGVIEPERRHEDHDTNVDLATMETISQLESLRRFKILSACFINSVPW